VLRPTGTSDVVFGTWNNKLILEAKLRKYISDYAEALDWICRRSGRTPGTGNAMCQKLLSELVNSTPM